MTETDRIWNRGTTDEPGISRYRGDLMLRAMLRAHGLAMNGGVLHAAELLSTEKRSSAQEGYRFFGLAPLADLLGRARLLFEAGEDLGSHEAQLDAEYAAIGGDDSVLYERFERHLRSRPSDFAPL